jgi:coiled-coil domain-containing protein 12
VNKDDKEESSLAKDSSQPVIADSDIIKNELRQFQDEEELNILPKNNNWDLKKQLEPKLEKLRRRTQRAIVDILREKMAEESESEEDEGEVEGEM